METLARSVAPLLLAPLAACSLGSAAPTRDAEAARRDQLVAQLAAEGIRDKQVLEAIRRVPRHEFVPPALRSRAYEDTALPIGEEQTISQPFVVARMTELAGVRPGARVLEVGTGSGYQAAVLAELGAEVYSIEIVAPLARTAAERLRRLGYRKVQVRHGDGYRGWPEKAPFDVVMITAAPPAIPAPLEEQLKTGGRLIAPVGTGTQVLTVVERTASGKTTRTDLPVVFVPMTGEAQAPSDRRAGESPGKRDGGP